MNDIQIGYAVRAARLNAGMTARQLAEGVGLTPVALSKIENGHQVLLFATSYAITQKLGITLEQLKVLAQSVGDISTELADARSDLQAARKKHESVAVQIATATLPKAAKVEIREGREDSGG